MLQMLVHYMITDHKTFRGAFDADAENRNNNSLSLLQIWRESHDSIWALYSVSNADTATEYLNTAAKVFNSQAGVRETTHHLLETI